MVHIFYLQRSNTKYKFLQVWNFIKAFQKSFQLALGTTALRAFVPSLAPAPGRKNARIPHWTMSKADGGFEFIILGLKAKMAIGYRGHMCFSIWILASIREYNPEYNEGFRTLLWFKRPCLRKDKFGEQLSYFYSHQRGSNVMWGWIEVAEL